MVDVRADGLDRLDPQLVDPLDVVRSTGPAACAPSENRLTPPSLHSTTNRVDEIRIVRRPVPGLAEQCAWCSGGIISDSPTTITPDLQLHGRLRQRVEDVRAGRDQQLHAAAVPLGDRDDPREQRLLVVREHLVVARARRAVPPGRSSRTVSTTTSRSVGVGCAEHPVELRQRVVVAHRHQHAARPAAERLDADLALRCRAGTDRACAAPAARRRAVIRSDTTNIAKNAPVNSEPGDRRDLLREQVDDRARRTARTRSAEQADRQLAAADPQVERHRHGRGASGRL